MGTPRLAQVAVVAALAMAASACGGASPQPTSRVWSNANSNDGYASCPADTTVTGGGFEMKDKTLQPGHVPVVVASKPEGNGWRVVCADASGTTACRAWALCASVLAR